PMLRALHEVHPLSLHDALPIFGPDHRNLLDVVHGTNGSRKNLGLEVVIVIDGTDLGNELDPVDAHVVDAADKGRDEGCAGLCGQDRKSTRLNSSHVKISYAVFC